MDFFDNTFDECYVCQIFSQSVYVQADPYHTTRDRLDNFTFLKPQAEIDDFLSKDLSYTPAYEVNLSGDEALKFFDTANQYLPYETISDTFHINLSHSEDVPRLKQIFTSQTLFDKSVLFRDRDQRIESGLDENTVSQFHIAGDNFSLFSIEMGMEMWLLLDQEDIGQVLTGQKEWSYTDSVNPIFVPYVRKYWGEKDSCDTRLGYVPESDHRDEDLDTAYHISLGLNCGF